MLFYKDSIIIAKICSQNPTPEEWNILRKDNRTMTFELRRSDMVILI